MKIINAVLVYCLFGLATFGLWKGLNSTDLFKIQNIKILGADPATAQRLSKELTLKVGDPLWEKPVSNQADLLKRDPWVDEIRIERVLPNNLLIHVKERKPVAVLGNPDRAFQFIDSRGDVIDQASPDHIGSFPTLFGKTLIENQNLRMQALNLIKSLPDKGLVSQQDLSDVNYDKEHGFQFRLTRTGLLIDLGTENLPLHVDRARRVVQYLDQHNIHATRVDSDYAKKVLVKVRKDL